MSLMRFIRERIWSALPVRVSSRQRLAAAILWGGTLILWGAFRLWRASGGHATSTGLSVVLLAGGGTLAVALLLPAVGTDVYLGVMRVVSIVGFGVSHLVLILAFYFFVTPMGWLLRLCGKDLLDIRSTTPPTWKTHPTRTDRKRYYRLS